MTSLITPVAARPSSAVPPCTPRALRALRHIATRASSAVQPAAPTTLVDPAALNGLPEKRLSVRQAVFCSSESIPVENSVERVAASPAVACRGRGHTLKLP